MSNKRIVNVTLGSDIEFFLQNKETEEVISAEGYIEGTKSRPFIFDTSSPFWSTSLDNVACEGNIPPVTKKDDWYGNITRMRAYIESKLPGNLCTIATPSHTFDPKWLQTDNARTFGCEPSFCVWTRSINMPEHTDTYVRSTGKHVHAVWNNMDIETIEEWVKGMDLFLGVPSVLIEPVEESRKRRTLYGKAGEFRHTEEMDRAEYRVLSSYFAKDKELCDYTFDQTQRAIDWVNGDNFIDITSPLAKDIVKAINQCDRSLAEKIVREKEIPVLA